MWVPDVYGQHNTSTHYDSLHYTAVHAVHEPRVIRTQIKYEEFILGYKIYASGTERYEKFISS